jgi:hypothetical protein
VLVDKRNIINLEVLEGQFLHPKSFPQIGTPCRTSVNRYQTEKGFTQPQHADLGATKHKYQMNYDLINKIWTKNSPSPHISPLGTSDFDRIL